MAVKMELVTLFVSRCCKIVTMNTNNFATSGVQAEICALLYMSAILVSTFKIEMSDPNNQHVMTGRASSDL